MGLMMGFAVGPSASSGMSVETARPLTMARLHVSAFQVQIPKEEEEVPSIEGQEAGHTHVVHALIQDAATVSSADSDHHVESSVFESGTYDTSLLTLAKTPINLTNFDRELEDYPAQ